jgi:hypothetical protein
VPSCNAQQICSILCVKQRARIRNRAAWHRRPKLVAAPKHGNRECCQCGATFPAYQAKQVVCSPACRRIHHLATNKQWYIEHAEQEREYSRIYAAEERKKDPERVRARKRAWNTANPERCTATARASRLRHPEQIRLRRLEYGRKLMVERPEDKRRISRRSYRKRVVQDPKVLEMLELRYLCIKKLRAIEKQRKA